MIGYRGLPLLLLAASVAGGLWGCGAERGGDDDRRLLLLVTVDTLRADHVGAFGGERGLTPNIDALAREGTTFQAAWAPTPFTLPSVAALLTGRYPEEVGIVRNDCRLPDDVPVLAETLADAGFRTAAVIGNFVLRSTSGLDRGFDVYDDDFTALETVRRVPERAAAETTTAALRALDDLLRAPGDAFLWVHYQDPHGPYTPPAGLRERHLASERERPGGRRELPLDTGDFGLGRIPRYQVVDGEREVAFYRAGYDGEVEHLDDELGRLLAGLSERGVIDDAVVAFTADHGEGLGERDYWFAHGEYLSEPLLRMPLVVRVPGRAPAERTDTVSMLDLAPTLLGLMGVAAPPGLVGRDLFADGAENASSSVYLATLSGASTPRIGVVHDGYRLVLSHVDGAWRERLAATGDDEPLRRPELVATLRAQLEELAGSLQRRPAELQPELSTEDLEALRALGYLGDG